MLRTKRLRWDKSGGCEGKKKHTHTHTHTLAHNFVSVYRKDLEVTVSQADTVQTRFSIGCFLGGISPPAWNSGGELHPPSAQFFGCQGRGEPQNFFAPTFGARGTLCYVWPIVWISYLAAKIRGQKLQSQGLRQQRKCSSYRRWIKPLRSQNFQKQGVTHTKSF